MWLLVDCGKGGGRTHEIASSTSGKTEVGRDPRCSITLQDVSVSRKHAEFETTTDSSSPAQLLLRDLKSTFGTFVNGTKLGANVPTPVVGNDLIKFGESGFSVFRLEFLPPTGLVFCSSGLNTKEKELLKELGPKINARIVEDFDASAVTHVILPNRHWRVTVKVLQGLQFQKRLVTIDWVVEFSKTRNYPNFERFQPTMQQVSRQTAEGGASQQQQQPSQLQQQDLVSMNTDFAMRKERKNMFANMDFVCIGGENAAEVYKVEMELIANGGGRVVEVGRDVGLNSILICSPSVDAFRRQFPAYAHLRAVDRTHLIHAILSLAPLAIVDGVKRASPVTVQQQQQAASVQRPMPATMQQQQQAAIVQRPPAVTVQQQQQATIVQRPPAVTVQQQQQAASVKRPPAVITKKPAPAPKVSAKHEDSEDDDEEEDAGFARARVVPTAAHNFAPKRASSPPPPPPVPLEKMAPPVQEPVAEPVITTRTAVFPILSEEVEWMSKRSRVSKQHLEEKETNPVQILIEDLVKHKQKQEQWSAEEEQDVDFKKFRKNVVLQQSASSSNTNAILLPRRRREIQVPVEAPLADMLVEERERSELKREELLMLRAFGEGMSKSAPGNNTRKPVAKAVAAASSAALRGKPASKRTKHTVVALDSEEEEDKLDEITEDSDV